MKKERQKFHSQLTISYDARAENIVIWDSYLWKHFILKKNDLAFCWITRWWDFLRKMWAAPERADPTNSDRIITAFENYIKEYYFENLLSDKIKELKPSEYLSIRDF